MLLSIEEKKDILKDLIKRRSKKFNKEYEKLLEVIYQNDILKNYETQVKNIKEEFQKELKSINTHDVDWESHERKGAEIEKKFNKELLDLKYEINSFLDGFNNLKKMYGKYKVIYNSLMKTLDKDEKFKNLKIDKIELPKISNINEINQIKENLKQELNNIEEIKNKYKIVSYYDLDSFEEKKFVISNEFVEFVEKIKVLSPKQYKRIKSLDTDKKLKLKEAKIIYQRLIYSKIYKEEINNILDEAPEYLKEKFELLKQKEIIYKDEYENLLDEYYNQESKSVSIDKIVKVFEDAGYKFEEVGLNEKGYINTDNEEYKIAYRIENNKLSLAFTRFVDKDTQVNEYERVKDKQMSKKWCGDFETIIKNLKKQGINLNKEMIKEPDEIEIRYEVVESKKSNQNYTINEKKMEK